MRDLILGEIKKLASEAGGTPPGVNAFTKATGIAQGKWLGVYWARWSDALAEAGLEANKLQGRFDSQTVLRKVADLALECGTIPTVAEMKLARRSDPSFPNSKTVASHFDGQSGLLAALREFCASNQGFETLSKKLPAAVKATTTNRLPVEGLVYLLKSGSHFKIGRSGELERRVKSISVALPEATDLVHSIRTDDPSGIEAYWHRRFADRRANGEWFRLTRDDVAAFRRRTYQ